MGTIQQGKRRDPARLGGWIVAENERTAMDRNAAGRNEHSFTEGKCTHRNTYGHRERVSRSARNRRSHAVIESSSW